MELRQVELRHTYENLTDLPSSQATFRTAGIARARGWTGVQRGCKDDDVDNQRQTTTTRAGRRRRIPYPWRPDVCVSDWPTRLTHIPPSVHSLSFSAFFPRSPSLSLIGPANIVSSPLAPAPSNRWLHRGDNQDYLKTSLIFAFCDRAHLPA